MARFMNYVLYLHDNEDKELFDYYYGTPFRMRGQMWKFSVLTDDDISSDTRLIRYHRLETQEGDRFHWSDCMLWVFPVSTPSASVSLSLAEIEAETQNEDPVVNRLRYLISNNPIPHRS